LGKSICRKYGMLSTENPLFFSIAINTYEILVATNNILDILNSHA